MNPGFVILFMVFGMGLVMGIAGMIHDLYAKKHGLVKGATESQLKEIRALLESLDDRVARIEENQAEQLLDGYRSDQDRLPRA
ncbi:hypothetical protein HN371_09750 [Candidatus Poribacteria bacterium]|jgi:hypothetical protein|nr:hypothetical protein [Candidatus Poribacteria bacterium]MBT5535404.1 hypothetical protein [Candidatus Poribacteria bacterium]MBT5714922.1 hypothetical protein [Candidatus Poribacteria bacterium]MBT7098991.1 hypothetical protein [Candidatus Poribacteria bacterium]MBT7809438.1 hypothetical protein [Candidatus Poribacteria bacterium]